ncbi:hypothetical protein BJ085DRAFT_28086 [Dimargaris cristalligena]|uniref:Uncharacterized protein n=1 Tax=Dimargaris cristalligena TaxID=215637 RepID=A0A4P9ZNP7_9FUNG|nr:hypothetical protein BJ085DRAFT_28086 [Dimargaris cristalligena]|eukprot:RKP34172.1 hypothetical protein BJ085DRAFT_28086 [Dimargaris cristalligena]
MPDFCLCRLANRVEVFLLGDLVDVYLYVNGLWAHTPYHETLVNLHRCLIALVDHLGLPSWLVYRDLQCDQSLTILAKLFDITHRFPQKTMPFTIPLVEKMVAMGWLQSGFAYFRWLSEDPRGKDLVNEEQNGSYTANLTTQDEARMLYILLINHWLFTIVQFPRAWSPNDPKYHTPAHGHNVPNTHTISFDRRISVIRMFRSPTSPFGLKPNLEFKPATHQNLMRLMASIIQDLRDSPTASQTVLQDISNHAELISSWLWPMAQQFLLYRPSVKLLARGQSANLYHHCLSTIVVSSDGRRLFLPPVKQILGAMY